jgi:hypothetical protein
MATTTNYGFEIPDDTDLVKDGALAMRDLGQDVDTQLFTALGGDYPGLRLIKKQTIGTAVNTVTVTSAFSATYEGYKIVVAGGSSSGTDTISCKLTGSGSNYFYSMIYGDYNASSPVLARGQNTANAPFMGYCHGADGKSAIFDIINPFLTRHTTFHGMPAGSSLGGATSGILKDTTSYTGFDLVSSSTMTAGTIYVYGYGAS